MLFRSEPVVLQLFTEETGIATRRAGLMASKTRPWQRVSVDALSEDGGIVEAKTTNWRLADEWDDDQVADHAEVQVQHALAVTGRSHAWVGVLIDGRDFRWRRVDRDEALIATLTAMEERFWLDHVVGNTPPAMEPQALDAVKDLYTVVELDTRQAAQPQRVRELLARRADLKALITKAEADLATVEAELIAAIADAEALVDGDQPLVTRKANGTFAAARFAKDHPDVATDYMTKPALDVDRIKTEHPEIYAQYRARVLRPVTPKEK